MFHVFASSQEVRAWHFLCCVDFRLTVPCVCMFTEGTCLTSSLPGWSEVSVVFSLIGSWSSHNLIYIATVTELLSVVLCLLPMDGEVADSVWTLTFLLQCYHAGMAEGIVRLPRLYEHRSCQLRRSGNYSLFQHHLVRASLYKWSLYMYKLSYNDRVTLKYKQEYLPSEYVQLWSPQRGAACSAVREASTTRHVIIWNSFE